MGRVKKQRIAVIDSETDPFEHGAEIKSFAWGFFDGTTYREFWDTSLLSGLLQLVDFLAALQSPLILYAHNGGKFDFLFLLQEKLLDPGEMLLINGRIVKAKLGIHELRDSYSILPIPLGAYQKDKIDYQKFKRDRRQKHRAEILAYLKSDCVYLFEFVSAFVQKFGTKLTIGATAINQLGKLHPVVKLGPDHDAKFRSYYFGGRVQCFETGKLTGRFKIFDVNSMYPAVMRNFQHPLGAGYITLLAGDAAQEFIEHSGKLRRFRESTYFVRFIGEHGGCLPVRTKDNGLSFAQASGEFCICSHEMKAGLELGLIAVDEILELHIPNSYQCFDKFVDHWAVEKTLAAKRMKTALENSAEYFDAFRDYWFAKFMQNSAYGKFATNPANFLMWYLRDTQGGAEFDAAFTKWLAGCVREDDNGIIIPESVPHLEEDMGRFEIWTAPAAIGEKSYFDVATAASITSAARATLMRAIAGSYRPIYCDTDSLICEDLTGVDIDDTRLGAWKLEKTARTIYIGGRKTYACFDPDPQVKSGTALADMPKPISIDGTLQYPIKIASKGAKLSPREIMELCGDMGDYVGAPRLVVNWQNPAPNFKLSGKTKYVERRIKTRFPVDMLDG